MNIIAEKKNLLFWIQNLTDENILGKIIEIKVANETSKIEEELINKGLNDFNEGRVSTHEEVKRRFESRFTRRNQ
jgi:predicted transcriptional regulator